mmetsp:Transcript_133565/g.427139  ORF Transcript_133565/g.427139 Transcript_133565/m.427139 type:complete len:391 (-) Transcript_133565:375-1547(-)
MRLLQCLLEDDGDDKLQLLGIVQLLLGQAVDDGLEVVRRDLVEQRPDLSLDLLLALESLGVRELVALVGHLEARLLLLLGLHVRAEHRGPVRRLVPAAAAPAALPRPAVAVEGRVLGRRRGAALLALAGVAAQALHRGVQLQPVTPPDAQHEGAVEDAVRGLEGEPPGVGLRHRVAGPWTLHDLGLAGHVVLFILDVLAVLVLRLQARHGHILQLFALGLRGCRGRPQRRRLLLHLHVLNLSRVHHHLPVWHLHAHAHAHLLHLLHLAAHATHRVHAHAGHAHAHHAGHTHAVHATHATRHTAQGAHSSGPIHARHPALHHAGHAAATAASHASCHASSVHHAWHPSLHAASACHPAHALHAHAGRHHHAATLHTALHTSAQALALLHHL